METDVDSGCLHAAGDSAVPLAEFRTWLDRGACRRRRCSYSKQPKYSLAAISGPEAVSALDAGKIAAFMVDHSRDSNINEYERAA